ncbi:MAG: MBL fold metallo-hydrolase [Gemmatimonadetes bacterium]|nr:MBL fold metallo-hydrolase [Gemmatimonadota bacterium]MSR35078.1 MBL fold metallo-hydrolase [Gemmatimonadota bacterium]
MTDRPRFLNAGNAGPFTLDGTRTYLVGRSAVAVIDPGPASESHLRALTQAVEKATSVTVVVTHGHPDHAPGARSLAASLGTDLWGPAGVDGVSRPLVDNDVVSTDEGDLIALETPGHARHHIGLHWPARRAFFAGDLVLGKGDTVWVGEYAGCVADYLASLERVRSLDLAIIYPAHGPPLESPEEALDRFVEHRRHRIRQMEALLAEMPGASGEELLEAIYGKQLPEGARKAALRSVEVMKAHVEAGPT